MVLPITIRILVDNDFKYVLETLLFIYWNKILYFQKIFRWLKKCQRPNNCGQCTKLFNDFSKNVKFELFFLLFAEFVLNYEPYNNIELDFALVRSYFGSWTNIVIWPTNNIEFIVWIISITLYYHRTQLCPAGVRARSDGCAANVQRHACYRMHTDNTTATASNQKINFK